MSDLEKEYNNDSCGAILDAAKSVYNEEIDRFKQIETKTGVSLGFTGVCFVAFLNFINNNLSGSKQVGYLIYSGLFKLFILSLIFSAAYFFLRSMRVGTFEQIDLENIVDGDLATKTPSYVKLSIGATYKNAAKANEEKIEQKIHNYSKGLKSISIAFVVFVIHYILEVIIKYAA